jgi:small subunit ribosomal protein S8
MSHSDPIADMLTRIRNAYMAKHEDVSFRASNVLLEITKILKQEGYVQGYECIQDGVKAIISIQLRYTNQIPALKGIKRESTPGRRIYTGKGKIPWVRSGMGVSIVSTSSGMMTGKEARQRGIGGEVMCSVW